MYIYMIIAVQLYSRVERETFNELITNYCPESLPPRTTTEAGHARVVERRHWLSLVPTSGTVKDLGRTAAVQQRVSEFQTRDTFDIFIN